MTLRTAPAPPVSLDPTAFIVRVADSAGRPVSGARISVSLAMPAMDMGRNIVTVTETATRGTYSGIGRLTMAGTWQGTVTAAQGRDSAMQTFPLQVR